MLKLLILYISHTTQGHALSDVKIVIFISLCNKLKHNLLKSNQNQVLHPVYKLQSYCDLTFFLICKAPHAVYFDVLMCLCLPHPYEALKLLVSGQQFLVQFDSLQVTATELSIGLPHVVCTLT